MINPNLKIDHVHLKVSNLARSLQFYRSILGFKIIKQESKIAFLSAATENKDSFMPLVVLSEINNSNNIFSTHQHKQSIAGLYHFAILLPERKYLAYFLQHIQNNLNPDYYEGMADHAVSESIYMHDPDFNGIEIYRDKPYSEWKWQDSTVHMVTEPLDVQDLKKEILSINGYNEWRELPPKTSIGHVHLQVSNLFGAKRFYHDIVELNHTATLPGAYFFAANRYHHHIGTNTWLGENIDHANDKNNDDKPGLDHFAINLHDLNDLLLLKNRFLEFKIEINEKLIEDDYHVLSSFYAYDFDGIKIQFLYKK